MTDREKVRLYYPSIGDEDYKFFKDFAWKLAVSKQGYTPYDSISVYGFLQLTQDILNL